MLFNAENFNIYSLGADPVSYNFKDIHTLAIQATPENIGGLSLEFESGLRYNRDGVPFFSFKAERDVERSGLEVVFTVVHPTDWIVVLWNELHLFHDKEFKHTFSFDNSVDAVSNHWNETPGGFGIGSGEVTGPTGTQVVPAVSHVGEERQPGETQD